MYFDPVCNRSKIGFLKPPFSIDEKRTHTAYVCSDTFSTSLTHCLQICAYPKRYFSETETGNVNRESIIFEFDKRGEKKVGGSLNIDIRDVVLVTLFFKIPTLIFWLHLDVRNIKISADTVTFGKPRTGIVIFNNFSGQRFHMIALSDDTLLLTTMQVGPDKTKPLRFS